MGGSAIVHPSYYLSGSFCAQHLPHVFAQAGGDIGAFESEGYRGGQQAEGSACIIAFAGKDDAITMPGPGLNLNSVGDLNLSTPTGRRFL